MIPAHVRASATRSQGQSQWCNRCHTRSCAGFCNRSNVAKDGVWRVVIPAHVRASATDIPKRFSLTVSLSYPLMCGLLQPANNTQFSNYARCHTRSCAGFCNILAIIGPAIFSCHTRSCAGFCNECKLIHKVDKHSCHTRSCAGFCNDFIQTPLEK